MVRIFAYRSAVWCREVVSHQDSGSAGRVNRTVEVSVQNAKETRVALNVEVSDLDR